MNRKGQAALAVLAGAVVAGWLGGCAADGDAPTTIRLVERFAEAERSNEPAGLTVPEPIEWRFDGGATAGPWSPGPMVTSTRVASGRLAGRAAGPLPGILLSAEGPLGDDDRLHAVEVRIRVSAGSDLLLIRDIDDQVERIATAIMEAVGAGELDEARLTEAASRVRGLVKKYRV